MPNPLRFGDHSTFHIQVLRVTVAGAALGLAGYLVDAFFGSGGQWFKAVAMAVVAMTLGLAATPPTRKTALISGALALGVGMLGSLAFMALFDASARYLWFGVFVYGLSIGIIAARDLADRRRYLMPLASGLMVMVALFVVTTFARQVDFTSYVPGFVAGPAYGALFGFLFGVSLIVRQVWIAQDPVGQAFSEVRPKLSGEMLDLCQRAMALYARIQEVLHDRRENGSADPELSRAVKDMVLRIFGLAHKWHEVEREAARSSASDLHTRVEEIDAKLEATSDPVARRQYRMAREALSSQARYLDDISRNRERVTAQVYNYLAALERLHLAVINHRGADAAKLTDEIAPILDEIEDVGQEMDLVSDAISEAAVATDEAAVATEEPAEVVAAEEAPSGALALVEEPPAPAEPEDEDPEARLNARLYE